MTELKKIQSGNLIELLEKKSRSFLRTVTDEQARELEKHPHTYSVFVDGELLMCGGATEYWKDRAEAWAVLDPKCRRHFMELHIAAKQFLKECPIRRIEAAVEVDFESGHRWVRALGFSLEAKHLRSFFPNGGDASLYSLVKHG